MRFWNSGLAHPHFIESIMQRQAVSAELIEFVPEPLRMNALGLKSRFDFLNEDLAQFIFRSLFPSRSAPTENDSRLWLDLVYLKPPSRQSTIPHRVSTSVFANTS